MRNTLVAFIVVVLSLPGSLVFAQLRQSPGHPLQDSIVREAGHLARQSSQVQDEGIPPAFL